MALRIVDNQMMLTKPAEIAGDKAREQRMAGVNITLGQELDKNVQDDLRRVQQNNETEETRLNPDDSGHNQKSDSREAGPGQEDIGSLSRLASDQLLNLPVAKGKYAKSEEHQIDILV